MSSPPDKIAVVQVSSDASCNASLPSTRRRMRLVNRDENRDFCFFWMRYPERPPFFRRGGRAVDRAGLENRKAERPREFKSPLRRLTWPPSNGYFVKFSRDRRIVISLGSQQMADISISSSPPFPPPVRSVIFAFSKSSAVNPFLRRTCLAKPTSLVLTALISSSRSPLLA